MQHLEQLLHVREVEARRGLIEQVHGPPGRSSRELGGQLHALGLAARQGGRRLPHPDVAETDVHERLELGPDGGHGLEDAQRFLHGHLEDVGDGVAAVVDLQRLARVALPTAHLAGHVDIGQELHLDLEDPVAPAVLAAPALDVEAEAAGLVTAQARLGDAGEQLADGAEEAGVGGGVGTRGPPDGALVDLDDLVDRLDPLQPVVVAWLLARPAHPSRQRAVEDLGDQRALARAGDARDRREGAQRESHVEILEVVGTRAAHDERLAAAGPTDLGDGHAALAAQVGSRHRPR